MDDQSNPFGMLLRPEVLAALTLLPVVLQYLRGIAAFFKFTDTAAAAAILNALGVLGVVVWTGWQYHFTPLVIAGQVVAAWLYTEAVYVRVVKPMSTGANPLMPDTNAPTK